MFLSDASAAPLEFEFDGKQYKFRQMGIGDWAMLERWIKKQLFAALAPECVAGLDERALAALSRDLAQVAGYIRSEFAFLRIGPEHLALKPHGFQRAYEFTRETFHSLRGSAKIIQLTSQSPRLTEDEALALALSPQFNEEIERYQRELWGLSSDDADATGGDVGQEKKTLKVESLETPPRQEKELSPVSTSSSP